MQPEMAPTAQPEQLDAAPPVPAGPGTACWGVLLPEEIWSAEGPRRCWAAGAATWAPLPISLKWQPAEDEGHEGAVVAGRIDQIWRDGMLIRFIGAMDSAGTMGAEAERLVGGGFVSGISIMADDVCDDDVELIYPMPDMMDVADLAQAIVEAEIVDSGMDDMGDMEPEPEALIMHAGRIRSATILPEPAFTESFIRLGASPYGPPVIVPAPPLVAAAVASHSTAISEASAWDGPAAEKALPSFMTVDAARNFYAWIDDGAIDDGKIPKTGGRFGHHDVSDGSPGSANVRGCQSGIGVLNGGRGGTTIPSGDVQGVYNHLARHLRDAGLEPPALTASYSPGPTVVVSTGYTITIPEIWPESWFDEPAELPPFGAIHVTQEGRVFGLLGPDRVSHRAFRASGQRVTVPRGIDYSEFQNKPALVAGADGQVYRINAGSVTFDCGHASPVDARRADPAWAMQHYDNSCSVAARVRVGEGKHGTWVAGGLLHGITADAIERMMACALSGDWQGGRLVGALLVPVEGFPRATSATVRVREDALVSSSVPMRFSGDVTRESPARVTAVDLRPTLEREARRAGRDATSRFAALRSRVFPYSGGR